MGEKLLFITNKYLMEADKSNYNNKSLKRKIQQSKHNDDSDDDECPPWEFRDGKVIPSQNIKIITVDDTNWGCIDEDDRDFVVRIMQLTSLLKAEYDPDVKIKVSFEKDFKTSEVDFYIIEISFSSITKIHIDDLNAIQSSCRYRVFFPTMFTNDENRLTVKWKISSHKLRRIHKRTSWLITHYEGSHRTYPIIDDQNGGDGYNLIRRKKRKTKHEF